MHEFVGLLQPPKRLRTTSYFRSDFLQRWLPRFFPQLSTVHILLTDFLSSRRNDTTVDGGVSIVFISIVSRYQADRESSFELANGSTFSE